jgi:MFS family permease
VTLAGSRLTSPMWLAAYAFAVVMLGTTLPTPLYPHYEQRYGFSALTITVIFAVYAFGVIAALLFLGGLSDQLGRRPALLAGLALSAASAAAFLLAPAFAAVIRMPETVRRSGHSLLRMQRLRVPAELRGTFTRAATAGFASFTMSGLFSAVAPIFLATLLHLPSPALSGVTVFLLFASSAAGQLVITRIPARAGLSTGCIGVITGAGLVAAALALESLALLIAGAIVAGLGQGLSVGAGLAAINAEAPADRRAEVASSFFVVLYVGLSIPIIGTGLASQVIGLRASALIFSGFVAALAAACLISLLGRRPTGSSRPGDGAQ